MKGAVVPTKYGYNLVMLPPYNDDWQVKSPIDLPKDLELIFKSEILRQLAIYAHQLSGWRGQLMNTIPWALWGGLVLYLRLSAYASMGGWKTILLYGWIMFLFFGDGLFSFMRFLHQVPNLLKVRQIVKMGNPEIIYHDTKWWWSFDDAIDPTLVSEREYLSMSVEMAPTLKPYYDEMLRTEPPIAFSLWPLGMLGFIRYLTQGPRIPRPCVCVELGRLD